MLGKMAMAGLIGGSAVTGGVVVSDNQILENMQQKMFEYKGALTAEERDAVMQKRAELSNEYYADWENLNPLERFEARYQYAKAFNNYLENEMCLELPFTHISEWFSNLTEENQILIMDKYNDLKDDYDWDNMEKEDLINAREEIKLELEAYILELGLELPDDYYLTLGGLRNRDRFTNFANAQLTEEQRAALIEFKDNLLAQYDFENMTDEEKVVAREEIKVAIQTFMEEQGIEYVPQRIRNRVREALRRRFNDTNETTDDSQINTNSSEI